MPVDVVRVDSIYNPFGAPTSPSPRRAVGQRTDYDRLTLTVETNGTISPEDARRVRRRAGAGALPLLRGLRQGAMVAAQPAETAARPPGRLREVLARSIDDVGLSVRSVNSLKNSNIRTLAISCQYREEDLLKSRTSARRRSVRSPSCCAARGSTSA